MEIVGWLWWLGTGLLGLAWSVVWFLVGGWVATLAQIGIVALVVFGYKYGWRQAPRELLARAGTLVRHAWRWMRTGEPGRRSPCAEARGRPAVRGASARQPGDVNLSTLLSVLMLAGIIVLALA